MQSRAPWGRSNISIQPEIAQRHFHTSTPSGSGGAPACIGSAEENALVTSLAPPSKSNCSLAAQSGCLWIGLYQSGATLWDSWRSGCTSLCQRVHGMWWAS